MKKLSFIFLICLAILPMRAQETTSATKTGTSVQIESSVTLEYTNTISDVTKPDRTVIKQSNGYYLYLYDVCCRLARIFDERYALKIFLGANYDDALRSLLSIMDWYKGAKNNQCMKMTTAEGQEILIMKSASYGMMMTAGNLSDMEWTKHNAGEYAVDAVFFSNVENPEHDLAHKVERRIANGDFNITGTASQDDMRKAIKLFKKKYGI